MNKLSKILQPISTSPKDAITKNQDLTSKSQKLMVELGLISSANNGFFTILPLAQRSVEKCIGIVDFYMKKIGAQKISLPSLTSIDLWKKSGRYGTTKTELLTTTDRHDKVYILGPTHEEAVTSLMANIGPISYRQFPLRLYQVYPSLPITPITRAQRDKHFRPPKWKEKFTTNVYFRKRLRKS